MKYLQDLVDAATARAAKLPTTEPDARPGGPSLASALAGKDKLDVIAEFKQASPSAGNIAQRDLRSQVTDYVSAGAAALSVLTEPTRFKGEDQHVIDAVATIDVPVLMKDFVVSPAQIRHAARLGARGVLLIVRCLDSEQLVELADACVHYGLSALVECHDANELERALALPDVVIGVNNRDLDTFDIDRQRAVRLLKSAPAERVVVAESGYEQPQHTDDIRGLADAVLIGSALMRSPDPAAFIAAVRA